MNDVIVGTQRLVILTCGSCGIQFGIPKRFDQEHREDGREFWCPNGHCLSYKETEADRLKNQLIQAQLATGYERERRLATERRLSATKAAHTRTKNRIKNGVCPCCNRHFLNLQRHIETKHPGYKDL